jgi:hypothetical protein
MQSFASIRSTPFMEIDDKGGRSWNKDIYASWGEVEVGHGHGPRGSKIGECKGSKFLDKRCTQVGEQAHEL